METDEALNELLEMHTYMRPEGSEAQREFCARYIDCLPGIDIDKVGNRIGVIGDDPVTLWSSHTDTVHKNSGRQLLAYGDGFLTLGEYKPLDPANPAPNCLGADCTVGVWLMRRMFLAGVPGLYVWHTGEECGGIGSSYIANETPALLRNIQSAIAFDRRGTDSVITHQFGDCTASTTFAQSLSLLLGDDYAPDQTGVFTDTANYAELIPECTNISVGYEREHSKHEFLDIEHALRLLDTMLEFDETRLLIARNPAEAYITRYNRYYEGPLVQRGGYTSPTMEGLIKNNPEGVAEFLRNYGITYQDLREALVEYQYKERDYGDDALGWQNPYSHA
jgi:hypothetical protein